MKLRTLFVLTLLSFVSVALVSYVWASESEEAQSEAVHPTIDDFAWFTGHWLGEENGGDEWTEETWGAAHDGLILGMFRQDSPRQTFYELFTLAETDAGIELRIKHFNPGLVAWEEKEESVLFQLVEVRENHATFVDEKGTRLVYDREGDLFIAALEKDRDGQTRRFEFRFRRAPL